MGQVFLAAHERLPMKLVVKVLSPTLISAEAVEQFRHEALVLAKLQHPNIVQLVDFDWTESGLPYLVMEHLPGRDLGAILRTQDGMGPGQSIDILSQIGCALYAAHRRGVVHRDLAPKNVMVVPYEGRGDVVKLIDFGVSIFERTRTAAGRDFPAGTPEFMSPEQALGRFHDVGPSSDEFSLAVIAHLLLSGHLPWTGSSRHEMLERIINGRPAPLPGHLPSVETVLLRGLAKQPEHRYPSTLAFVRALQRAMAVDGLLPDIDESATEDAADTFARHAESEVGAVFESSTVTSGAGESAGLDEASDAEGDGGGVDSRTPLTSRVRLRQPPRSHRPWKWVPILIGAVLGATFGLAGPRVAGDRAGLLWKRMHVGASHAATAVVEESRQVLFYLSSRSWR